jgi:hypothetical protein
MEKSDNNPPKLSDPTKSPISAGWSYIYVGFWNIWYTLKIRMIGTIVAVIVFILSAIELIGPFTHLIHETPNSASRLPIWQTEWIRYGLASLLFLTAVIMIWYHTVLDAKVKRYRNLITFVMVLAGNIGALDARYGTEDAVQMLDGFTRAVDHRAKKPNNKPLLNASILIRADKQSGAFSILAQDSCKAFKTDILIPEENSVAGRTVRYDTDHEKMGTLMYVPSSRYVHGIAIRSAKVAAEEAGKTDAEENVFTETEIVPTTYRVVDKSVDTDVLKCLLCIQIPLKQPQSGQERSYSCAVLSLSGRKVDCMNSVHFMGAKLASALLAEVL